MNKKVFSGFQLFSKAYRATQHEIGVSLKMLFIVTLCFAVLLYLAESTLNADYTFWDALVWTFVKYVDDPADISTPPVTIIG